MPETPVRILLMEDDAGQARLFRKRMERAGCVVDHAPDGEKGLEMFDQGAYDLVVLDHAMPVYDGLEVLRRLASRGPLPPIVMVTGCGNERVAVEAMKLGALDYIVKDVDGGYLDLLPVVTERALHQHRLEAQMRLAAKVFESAGEGILVTDPQTRIISVNEAFTTITGYEPEEIIGKTPLLLQARPQDTEFHKEIWPSLRETGKWQGEIWNRRKNGEAFPAWLTLRAVEDEQGRTTNYVGMLTDITFRKQVEERLRYLATHDPLTGLPNRDLFQDRLLQALAHARRSQGSLAVLLFDLDHFKMINDTMGHATGDLILKGVAERLLGCIRECDTGARLGGDEFIVLLSDLSDPRDATVIAERILDEVAKPFVVDGRGCPNLVTASIGISLYPEHGEDPEALIRKADTAMYVAKEQRNCYVFCDTR